MKLAAKFWMCVGITVMIGGFAFGQEESTPRTVSTNNAGLFGMQLPENWHASDTPNQVWGVFDPGKGFLVGRTPKGELSISLYALLRYINQMPASQNFTDHLGNEHPVDNREDFFSHRIMVWFKGWVYDPKLVYTIFIWTVNTTDQDGLFGNIGYQFDPKFNVYGGIGANGGSRSLLGSHPFWLGHDRVMADEFFRPYFTYGIWAQGEVVKGLWYHAIAGNNNSALGIKASQLDRKQTFGGSLWWMPTTDEFGPRGAYGDYEFHDQLALRFGVSGSHSPEQRFAEGDTDPGNTTLKLADGLNVFSTGALADGVTVRNVDYDILSVDAGMKYKGVFLQAEYYTRQLSNFDTDGPIPHDEIVDTGFYVQGAFFPFPKKLELYAATSQIFGDSDAGFDNSSEYLCGLNFYPFKTRDTRLNIQYAIINDCPVGSTFGYYTAGQDGETLAVAYSILF
jgi:hypothetical protein